MYNVQEGIKVLTQTFWGAFAAVMCAGIGAQVNCAPVSMAGAILTGMAINNLNKKETVEKETTTTAKPEPAKDVNEDSDKWWENLNTAALDPESHIAALKWLLEETGSKWEPESLKIDNESSILDCVVGEGKLHLLVDRPTTNAKATTWLKKVNNLGGTFKFAKEIKTCSVKAQVETGNECLIVIEGIGME